MITSSDPLPDDLETAHRVIRELLETLGQQIHLNENVPLEQRVCPDCGIERTCIGKEIREQLEYVPASFVVLEHIRPKYACQVCAGNVVIAERLPEPIDKGLPGPGLMATSGSASMPTTCRFIASRGSSRGSESSYLARQCAIGWPSPPSYWHRSSS